MQRFTTVLKSSINPMQESASVPVKATRADIYIKNQPSIKSSNDYSSSPLNTNSDSSSSDTTNNETVTLTNANDSFVSSSARYNRPIGRRFLQSKSKSAAVSRSTSSSRISAAEQIYLNQNSSDEEKQLSSSETDELNSDEDNKLVYKTCMESPLSGSKGIYLKKSASRPECALKNFQFNSIELSKPDSSRRFVKNGKNRLRASKSMSQCKDATFQSNDDDEEDLLNEEEEQHENLYYRQLDGHMKTGRLSRFKVIKSKSNSAIQSVRNSDSNRKYDQTYDIKQLKGNQRDDQITSQLQLNELAERLKFIEQKLLENELNVQNKYPNQNISTSYQPAHLFNQTVNNNRQPIESTLSIKSTNDDDLCLNNGLFQKRIYPSISFGDCSEINSQQPKNTKTNNKRFFSSTKSAIKNSRSIPSLFIANKEKNEKTIVDKLGGGTMKSSSKIWKTPLNILSNINQMVDDKLRGRWNSTKSVKYDNSSSSNSIRSNSICSASNLTNNKRTTIDQSQINHNQQRSSDKFGPLFNNRKDRETKSLNNKFVHNISNLSSRKNSSQNIQSNGSSQNDLAKSIESRNSSQFSSTKNLDVNMFSQSDRPQPKARAFSTPNEEIFNLLSVPFMDEETNKMPENELDRFDYKLKQSKSYKEIGSQALKEIEEFEKLLSDKFAADQFK